MIDRFLSITAYLALPVSMVWLGSLWLNQLRVINQLPGCSIMMTIVIGMSIKFQAMRYILTVVFGFETSVCI